MGLKSASTVVCAMAARTAAGLKSCEHGRERHRCKECGGSQICEHGRQRCRCKECGGASICEHGRVAPQVQRVRWIRNLRARSSALYMQGLSSRRVKS